MWLLPIVVLETGPLDRGRCAREFVFEDMGSSCAATSIVGMAVLFSVGTVKNVSSCEVIMLLTPAVNSLTCFRKYSRKASLFQRPSSMIVVVRAWARWSSIAQLVRREWVPTRLRSMPSASTPMVLTVCLRCCRHWDEVIRTSLFDFGSWNVLTVDL